MSGVSDFKPHVSSNVLLSMVIRYPFLALEIFNCEINPLLEKFFEAPEPKETSSPVAATEKDKTDDEVVLVNLDDEEPNLKDSDEEEEEKKADAAN